MNDEIDIHIPIGVRMAALLVEQQERRAALHAALVDMFAMIEEGYLVRDTRNDAEPGWAMKQIAYVSRLAACHAAIMDKGPSA